MGALIDTSTTSSTITEDVATCAGIRSDVSGIESLPTYHRHDLSTAWQINRSLRLPSQHY